MNSLKIITFYLVIIIYLFLCKSSVISADKGSSQNYEYHRILERLYAKKGGDKISVLKEFLFDNPDLEKIYLKLLSEFTYTGHTSEANLFFINISKNPHHTRNGYWMLAKLSNYLEHPLTAKKYYFLALKSGPISPAFIYDFLKFIYTNSNGDTFDFYDQLQRNDDELLLVSAYKDYVLFESRSSIRYFEMLSDDFANDLDILYHIGKCYNRLGEEERAEAIWRKGLRCSKDFNDLEKEARFYLALGTLTEYFQTKRGLSYYDSSYAIANKIGDLSTQEFLLGNKAIMCRRNGDLARAADLFKEVIDISTTLNSKSNLCRWYFQYGLLLDYMQRYDEALRYYNLAETYAKEANNERIYIQVLYFRGDLYSQLGLYSLAMNSLQRAKEAATIKKLAHIEHRTLIGIADIHFYENKMDKAGELYSNYIEKGYMDDRSYCFDRLGLVQVRAENYENAEECFLKAYNISKKMGLGYNKIWSRIRIADLSLKKGLIEKARINYEQSLKIVLAKEDSSTLPAIYVGLGNVAKSNKEYVNAIAEYMRGIQIIEQLRTDLVIEEFKIGYFPKAVQIYDHLIECYYHLYNKSNNVSYLDSILLYIELNRGRSLKDKLVKGENQFSKNLNDQSYQEYKRIESNLICKQRLLRNGYRLVKNDQYLGELEADIKVLQLSLLTQRFNIQNQLKSNINKWITHRHLLESISKENKSYNRGLLLYQITDSVSFALVVANDKISLIPLNIIKSDLNDSITQLLNPFYQVDENTISETPFRADIAYKLYTSLIEPIESSVNLPRNLMIIPDIEIVNLPFDLLMVAAPKSAVYTPKDNPVYSEYFLLNRYVISYSPNVSKYSNYPWWKNVRSNIIVFANPFNRQKVFEENQIMKLSNSQWRQTLRAGWSFDPLPFSEIEAKQIKEIIPEAKILTKSKASESMFLKFAHNFDIVQIASHVFIDSVHDYFSGVVLSSSSDSSIDGLLMGYEICDMNFDTDLIILNSCASGKGRSIAGEGILGLPRLFLGAGANSVIMTLWRIDDHFASEIIPRFFNMYINENLSKSEALSVAKQSFLKNSIYADQLYSQHPVFWAGYILYGDPGHTQMAWIPFVLFLILVLSFIIYAVLSIFKKKCVI